MCGLRKTVDYVDLCDSLDLFEINPDFAAEAARVLPSAAIHLKDSIRALDEETLPRDEYSFILIDNPPALFGAYCEHFELFPKIYTKMAEQALMIVNVQLDSWVEEAAPEHLERRKVFYQGSMPNARTALEFYNKMAESKGRIVQFSGIIPHPGNMIFVMQSTTAAR